MFKNLSGLFFIFVLGLTGCGGGGSSDSSMIDPASRQFGVFKVLDNDTTVEMSGEISSSALSDFNALLEKYPNVKLIDIIQCGGSSDDEINLQVSKLVHDKGINTHLRNNGLIASGGVDFFLAGVNRSKGTNTMIGVHSWSDGSGAEATDFPEGNANHLPYIEYYKSVGFTQGNAEDFYYFTINAAPADSIYYMSDSEIQRYSLITN